MTTNLSRKNFLKMAGAWVAGAAAGGLGTTAAAAEKTADVYFSPVIDAEHLIKLYEKICGNLTGKIAVKLHTGERHGPNILPRLMVAELMKKIPGGTIVETNTLYHGDRYRDCHEFCVHGIIGAHYTGTPHEHNYQETNLS